MRELKVLTKSRDGKSLLEKSIHHSAKDTDGGKLLEKGWKISIPKVRTGPRSAEELRKKTSGKGTTQEDEPSYNRKGIRKAWKLLTLGSPYHSVCSFLYTHHASHWKVLPHAGSSCKFCREHSRARHCAYRVATAELGWSQNTHSISAPHNLFFPPCSYNLSSGIYMKSIVLIVLNLYSAHQLLRLKSIKLTEAAALALGWRKLKPWGPKTSCKGAIRVSL